MQHFAPFVHLYKRELLTPNTNVPMKRSIKNILLSLVGFSAAPMLTACYGTPYDDMYNSETYESIEGCVVDTEMQPIKNIEVAVVGDYDYTDENGRFSFSRSYWGAHRLVATDWDGEANGGDFGTQSVTVTHENHSVVSIVMKKK